MKKNLFSLLAFMLPMLVFSAEKKSNVAEEIVYPAHFPEWSWDKVQVCLHYAKREGITEEEAKFTAQFPLIALEKGQGLFLSDGRTFQGSDIGVEIAAAQIKKYNPDTKVLCYRSFRTDYGGMYKSGSILNPGETYTDPKVNEEWALRYTPDVPNEKSGQYVVVSSRYRVMDQTNASARVWWINDVTKWANKPNIDGIFIDAYGAIGTYDGVTKDYGTGKYEKWERGNAAKMNLVKNKITVDRIVLGNCVNGSNDKFSIKNSFEKLKTLSGGMMEHFCILGSKDPASIAASIQTIRDVARQGKILVVRGWPRYDIKDKAPKGTSQQQQEEWAREDIVFPLAVFLCGAGKYSYFCYAWSYGFNDGSHIMYDEYTKKLGAPKGEYVKKGMIFTREFEHASVWVDVKNRQAKIDWKE